MRYIKSPSTDAKFNLALEQYVFDRMDRSQSYFMLWQNDHAVIIGKHQNTIGEINEPYVREHHIDVVRRLSGGGAVYHDLGNLNFTFIVSEGDGLQSFDFSVFCRPIVQALAHFGVEAQINGRNDMTIAGKKFSGNSQYAKQGRIMHHGTILYDSDLDMVSKALQVSQDKIVSKGVHSVRSRVTNVREYMKEDIPVEAFWEKLEQYMAAETGMQAYTLTEEDIARIRVIQQQRYDTWEWNYGASPQYRIRKERRFEGCGKVEAYMEVEKGILHQLDFYGDYFGNGEKQQLIDALIGSKMEESALQKRLEDIDVGEYVCHLTQKDLIALLLQ